VITIKINRNKKGTRLNLKDNKIKDGEIEEYFVIL
jgi:hypothetical protein